MMAARAQRSTAKKGTRKGEKYIKMVLQINDSKLPNNTPLSAACYLPRRYCSNYIIALVLDFFIILLSIMPAKAADFARFTPESANIEVIFLTGRIEPGDSERFEKYVKPTKRATIALQGPGGSVSDALQIGAIIRLENWATMVLPDAECYSACALIWVASSRRYLSQDSKIGFHAAYVVENGNFKETGMGNAEIGSFLTQVGLSIEAIRFITAASPNQMNLLNPQIARSLGIDVFEQSGSDIISPLQRPTADFLAKKCVLLTGVHEICKSLFDNTEAELRARAEEAVNEGHKIVGGEQFANLLLKHIDHRKSEISRQGVFKWCIDAEEALRKGGTSLTTSPSFDCRRAVSSSEMAICRSPALSLRDRGLAALYRVALTKAGKNASSVKSDQRQWLKSREGCREDTICLASAYDLRIRQLLR